MRAEHQEDVGARIARLRTAARLEPARARQGGGPRSVGGQPHRGGTAARLGGRAAAVRRRVPCQRRHPARRRGRSHRRREPVGPAGSRTRSSRAEHFGRATADRPPANTVCWSRSHAREGRRPRPAGPAGTRAGARTPRRAEALEAAASGDVRPAAGRGRRPGRRPRRLSSRPPGCPLPGRSNESPRRRLRAHRRRGLGGRCRRRRARLVRPAGADGADRAGSPVEHGADRRGQAGVRGAAVATGDPAARLGRRALRPRRPLLAQRAARGP